MHLTIIYIFEFSNGNNEIRDNINFNINPKHNKDIYVL